LSYKLVHKKYIKRGGKTFGPYYYKTYREGDKVKTIYIGRTLSKEKSLDVGQRKKQAARSERGYPTLPPAKILLIIFFILIGSSLIFLNEVREVDFASFFTGKLSTDVVELEAVSKEIGRAQIKEVGAVIRAFNLNEYDYEATNGIYKVYFKRKLDEKDTIKFQKDDAVITIQPFGLRYISEAGYAQPIRNVNPLAEVEVNGNKITYMDAFGEGIDLVYTAMPLMLKEKIVIRDSSILFEPDPRILQNSPMLEIGFVTNHDLEAYFEGQKWDKKNKKITSENINFKSVKERRKGLFGVERKEKDAFDFEKPFSLDARGVRRDLEYELKKSGESLFVSVRIPYEVIQDTSFPLVIDPSISIPEEALPAPPAPEPPVNAEYTKYSIIICNGEGGGEVCNQQIFLNQIALKNEQGIYRPFREIVKLTTDNDLLKIEWKGKSITFAPFIQHAGQKFRKKVPGITGSVAATPIPPEITIKNKHKNRTFSYEYDLGFSNLGNFKANLQEVGLEIVETQGFSKDDLKVTPNKILLPDGIQFSWKDAIAEGHNIEITKDKIVATNVANKDYLLIDPVIGLAAIEDVGTFDNPPVTCCTPVSRRLFFKFPIKDIPADATINIAELVLNVTAGPTNSINVTAYNVTNQTWVEESNSAGLRDGLMGSPTTNTGNTTYIISPGFYFWNVTEAVRGAFAAGVDNLTLRINSTDHGFSDNRAGDGRDEVGSHNIAAVATVNDREEGVSTPLLNITYTTETINPLIEFIAVTPANGTNTTSTTLYVNVSITEANLAANLTDIDGTNFTMTCTGTAPNFICNFTSFNLAEGSHNFKAYVNDTAGNFNVTERRYITVDTIAPFIDYTGLTESNDSITGRNYIIVEVTASDSTTGVANYTFILVNISNGFTTELNRTFTTETSLNFTSLNNGTYLYNVTASDYVGNKNTTERRTITLNTSVPVITFVFPTPGDGVFQSSTTVTINVSVISPTDVSTCLLDWQAVNNTMTRIGTGTEVTCNYTQLSLADAAYTYKVHANNSDNLWAVTGSRAVTIDTINPLINFTTDTFDNGSTHATDYITVNVTITEINFANFTFVLSNATAEINRTFVTSSTATRLNFTSLPEGNYTFNVTITDKVGNKNFTLTRRVTLDSSAPTIYFISPTPNNGASQTSTTVYINVTVTDRNLVSDIGSCILTWRQGSNTASNFTMTKTANNGDNANVTCTYTQAGLSVATYTYKVLANDSADNLNETAERTVKITTSGNGNGNGGGCKCKTGELRCSTDERAVEECTGIKNACWQIRDECKIDEVCSVIEGEAQCISKKVPTCDEKCKSLGFDFGTCTPPSLKPGAPLGIPEFVDIPDDKKEEKGKKKSKPEKKNIFERILKFFNPTPTGKITGRVSDIGEEGCSVGEICSCGNGERPTGGGCIPNWNCTEWSQCVIDYNIEQILAGNISALGKQNRFCTDLKECKKDILGEQACRKSAVSFRSEEWCFVRHTAIIDSKTGNVVARVRPIFTGVPRFDIELGEQLTSLAEQPYCWYCSDGVQDYDETGLDCGGASCPACGFVIKIEKKGSLLWLLILLLALIALILLFLEARRRLREYIITKLKAIYSLILHKKYKRAMGEFYKIKKKIPIEKWFKKDKEIMKLHDKDARLLLLFKARHLDKIGMKKEAREARAKARRLRKTRGLRYSYF